VDGFSFPEVKISGPQFPSYPSHPSQPVTQQQILRVPRYPILYFVAIERWFSDSGYLNTITVTVTVTG